MAPDCFAAAGQPRRTAEIDLRFLFSSGLYCDWGIVLPGGAHGRPRGTQQHCNDTGLLCRREAGEKNAGSVARLLTRGTRACFERGGA